MPVCEDVPVLDGVAVGVAEEEGSPGVCVGVGVGIAESDRVDV